MNDQPNRKPWYKSISSIYYVCSLIGMLFLGIKYMAGYFKHYLTAPDETARIAYHKTFLTENNYLWSISLAQVIIVCILVLVICFEMRLKTKKVLSLPAVKSRINYSLRRLVKGITLIALSWILLYAWFTYVWAIQPYSIFECETGTLFWIIADILHCSSAFFFFYCFSALEFPNTAIKMEDFRIKRKKNNLYTALLSIGFVSLSIAGRCEIWNMERLGPILMSFWVALSMQFFFGKLDSFDLKVPRILIAPLYIYALIQMMWSIISGYLSPDETIIILIMALLFKTYFLFLFQYWVRIDTFYRYFGKYAREPKIIC